MEVLDPVVRTLRECGIEILEPRQQKSLTPMHRAVVLGQVDRLEEFRDDLNARDCFGYTPLHLAVLCGNLDVVKDLVALKADIDAQDKTVEGYTPLHIACKEGNCAIADALAAGNFDPNMASRRHGSALHLAIRAQNSWLVKWLVNSRHANVNAKDSSGRRPLHLISLDPMLFGKPFKKNDITHELVSALCMGSSKPSVDELDNDGCTPLHYAAMTGNAPVVIALLKLKADVNLADPNGRTALHYAVCGETVATDSGAESCVSLLIAGGAKLRVRDKLGQTPEDVIEVLLTSRVWRAREMTVLKLALTRLVKAYEAGVKAADAERASAAAAEELLRQEDEESLARTNSTGSSRKSSGKRK
mmetsp:Transcript_17686/g.34811  ORF Transcript_17686/g.34811 Transcript_17686/m.34811 type:complete len:360 (+) Transcript_17686:223-1302(+)